MKLLTVFGVRPVLYLVNSVFIDVHEVFLLVHYFYCSVGNITTVLLQ